MVNFPEWGDKITEKVSPVCPLFFLFQNKNNKIDKLQQFINFAFRLSTYSLIFSHNHVGVSLMMAPTQRHLVST